MNRLQKKCFIVSAGLHLFLVIIFVIGSAFQSAPRKVNDIEDLKFIPTKLIDGLMSGGGTPHAAAPPATLPPAPTPEVKPVPAPPVPAKVKESEPVKPAKAQAETLESVTERKSKLPEDSLRLVTRKSDSRKAQKQPSSEKTQEQQMADARRRAGEIVSKAAHRLGDGLSPATKVEDIGPRGEGPAYASFAAWVKKVYEDAWLVPEDATSEDAITKVSVTIASDGRITSSRIIQRSGDPQMDGSVQRTLDRVTTIGRPFPEGIKDSQRTYIIPFNMKSKQGRA